MRARLAFTKFTTCEVSTIFKKRNLRELGPLLTPDYPAGEGVSGPVATVASWDLPACWVVIT